MLLGLISDTHGLMRPEAIEALRGVDRIIHAGDVGKPEVLQALAKLAPVTAVRGNVDTGAWAEALPASAVVEQDGARIYVLHKLDDLDLDPRTAGFSMVISGHSHVPSSARRNGVLYINPGSAGPRRFRLPIALARLDLAHRPWQVESIRL